MKKQLLIWSITIIVMTLISNHGFALDANPLNPITFEPEGSAYNWETWYTGSTVSIVDNPNVNGVNTSAKVGKLFMPSGSPNWVGTKTLSINPIVITDENKFLSIDVYKEDLNQIQVSMESNDVTKPKAYKNIKPSKVNEWETFTIDFSVLVGDTMEFVALKPETSLTSNLAADAVFYFDNISWSSGPVAVNTVSNQKFNIFPNPAADIITICGVNNKVVKITNITGEVVKQEFIRNDSPINIADLKAGIYFISVESNWGLSTVRFIKNN
jgi:hypothetical protein